MGRNEFLSLLFINILKHVLGCDFLENFLICY